ncbi:hypothetical protein [Achromobacter insuavis]|uniref:hypothetical protein n=1 Tax=Achromobacter insuavis TaxID=1287735 RepID=UPI001F1420D4|nr:hypothetical protein [Achromobacter insuavis]
MLDKLKWEIAQLRELEGHLDIRCVYQSINCALSAWHMTDWVFQFMDESRRSRYTPDWATSYPVKIAAATPGNEIRFQLRNKLSQAQLQGFRTRVQEASTAVRICRYIADASKHRHLTSNPDSDLHATVVDWKPKGGGTWTLPIVVDRGKEYRLPDLMDTAYRFWAKCVHWQARATANP